MNTNNIELCTRTMDIVVDLEKYDYDNPEDFVVTIETDNETRVINVTKREVRKHSYEGSYVIFYEGLKPFALNSVKITCKYTVVVHCESFYVNMYIEPLATK